MLTNYELRLTTTKFFGSFPDIIDLRKLRKISKHLKRNDKFSIHDVQTKSFKKNLLVRLYYKLNIDKEKGCWIKDDWSDYRAITEGIGHRISYKLFNGTISSGMFICHHCDRRGCVNPFHLFEGTHIDNMNDHIIKNGKSLPHNPERLKQILDILYKDKMRLKI